MLLGMMVVGAGAAGYPDVDSNDNAEAIEVLQAVKVMVGDDNGNFGPDDQVTAGGNHVVHLAAGGNHVAVGVGDADGVVIGLHNGSLQGDQVNRAQMAVVMALLLDLNYDYYEGADPGFWDVPSWAAPYVAACYGSLQGVQGQLSHVVAGQRLVGLGGNAVEQAQLAVQRQAGAARQRPG